MTSIRTLKYKNHLTQGLIILSFIHYFVILIELTFLYLDVNKWSYVIRTYLK